MSEIIHLIRFENNERLGSDCLYDQNDHLNSNLSKNRPNCVFIRFFSVNDVAVFGCVIDKQYYIHQPGYIAGLIYGPRGPCYNGFPLHVLVGMPNIPLPNDKMFDQSKLKEFADDKINVTQKLKFAGERVENFIGKGENAGYQYFVLFPQCFQKTFTSVSFKVGIGGIFARMLFIWH